LAAQDGFTMTEVLLALMLGLMIVGAGAMMFTTAVRSQTGLGVRDQAIRQGRITMERLVREVRQGLSLDTAAGDSWSSQSLSIRTFVHSATCGGAPASAARICRVTYTCTAGSCTRVEADANTGAQGPPVPVVSGLATTSVFEYQADPSIECAAPPEVANEAVSIRDEATLRNSGPQSPSRVCVSLVFSK
jgi:prepilin-type N-terminal cleavage/methylation domain-containing protein